VPDSSVASPIEIKSVGQWQISSVLIARRISDVKAETLTDTSRTQFAHALDLKVSSDNSENTDAEGVRLMLGQQRQKFLLLRQGGGLARNRGFAHSLQSL
jgi:hypothetical protein